MEDPNKSSWKFNQIYMATEHKSLYLDREIQSV